MTTDAEPAIEATPAGNPGEWVTPDDYPAWALRANVEGIVRFRLTVNADGKVASCEITESSEVPDLDSATCMNLTRRGRFVPPRDEEGNPVLATWESRVRWRIPDTLTPAPEEVHFGMAIVVEKDGAVSSCEVLKSEGATFSEDGCDKLTKFKPILDQDGLPQRKRVRMLVRVVHEDIPQ